MDFYANALLVGIALGAGASGFALIPEMKVRIRRLWLSSRRTEYHLVGGGERKKGRRG